MTLSFPPFTRMIKILIAINVAVYFAQLLLNIAGLGGAVIWSLTHLGLIPLAVAQHGWIWQLVTYAFLHGGFLHIFFNMLALWMFGSTLEQYWGDRHFLEYFMFCAVGAAVITVGLAYAGGSIFGLSKIVPTVGASGGIYGVLLAFGMLFGDREIYMLPFPIAIKAKYMVAILILVTLAIALSGGGGDTAYIAHLGGLIFGYIYLKFVPGRGLRFMFSEGYFGLRNWYHIQKRHQDAKKFQVYLGKHKKDDPGDFPEDSEAHEPKDWNKKNGGAGPGGWVN